MLSQVALAEVTVLMVHWLLLNLVEVMWVELESTHLLSMRQRMPVIHEIVIIVLRMRSIVQIFASGHWQSILNHTCLRGVMELVLITSMLLPEVSAFGKLLVLSLV